MGQPSGRSPAEIAAELRRLQETSTDDRDRLSLLHEISVYQEKLLVQTVFQSASCRACRRTSGIRPRWRRSSIESPRKR